MQAAFCIGAMVRWLDYNDTWLAAEWGHPSDNLVRSWPSPTGSEELGTGSHVGWAECNESHQIRWWDSLPRPSLHGSRCSHSDGPRV